MATTLAMMAAAAGVTAGPAVAAPAVPATAPVTLPASFPSPGAGSSIGAAALRTALTQQGKPSASGAAGPNAYDSSGLVQWAFKQVGHVLPRTAAQQSVVGTPVALDQLQPGDLVFFSTPVTHVGIYVGSGKILNATTAGQPVQIVSMAGLPFHNARRI